MDKVPYSCVPYCERVGNLHIHTLASDGSASHDAVAQAATKAGLDFIIVTDHDVYLPAHQGWKGGVLLLVGQELRALESSHGNHLLVIGAQEDLLGHAGDPQHLIDTVAEYGGQSYIAHPIDLASKAARERSFNWDQWSVQGYSGIEIWNYMSEFKSHLDTVGRMLLYVFFPSLAIRGPFASTLSAWDQALMHRDVWAIGGSDAHAITYKRGLFKRQVFSYEHLFRMVNTHILVEQQWNGDLAHDAGLVYDALAKGRSFVAYDGLASARGFDFNAVYNEATYTIGESVSLEAEGNGWPVRFEVTIPQRANIRLLRDGLVVAQERSMRLVYTTSEPGVYRVEVYKPYLLHERGWIFSSPIRIKSA